MCRYVHSPGKSSSKKFVGLSSWPCGPVSSENRSTMPNSFLDRGARGGDAAVSHRTSTTAPAAARPGDRGTARAPGSGRRATHSSLPFMNQ